MSVLNKLTEGIVNRDLQKEGAALLNKWEKTGLLEGMNDERAKDGMARLLENQAKELLREASTMAGGDVEGFAAVAFPIVRRVFGNLIANDLVSVQPMSLPSGLIFFLDFTKNSARLGDEADDSLYGGGKVGQQITGGVSLAGPGGNAEEGFYALNNGYSSPTGSIAGKGLVTFHSSIEAFPGSEVSDTAKICRFDPDITSGSAVVVGEMTVSGLTQLNKSNLVSIDLGLGAVTGTGSNVNASGDQVRRLTQYSGSTQDKILVVLAATGSETVAHLTKHLTGSTHTITFAEADDFGGTAAAASGEAIGAVVGQSTWGLENNEGIPEIDIKVESVSVTAMTKKLKAKWTPELGQDLNAYHNLDAEVELTSILSEQIALEIDREIIEDLVKLATAKTLYWSRRPGKFLDRETGQAIGNDLANESLLGADFTGTVSEWYETLVETINDVSAQIHRKTLRGAANFVVCSPEVANILEFTAGFRANVTADSERGNIGAVNVGSLSKKWDVYVDPYFPRNVVLVGRKGGSFLESGYVYAPYVPLQVTPTIFGVEDFVPRKGVMTRYAKKMVRPDMYGLVICTDING
jgi:hypothetical protein